MARKRFHNLKRPKIRQDWSKWTLYNLSRLREPNNSFKTFFQQKWGAKSLARAYHGEQIRERKWQLMFDRRLPAVVPMDYKKLAVRDGSEAGEGRGRGRTELFGDRGTERTPYMHMTFWPVERRLDTAVWRALFASSAKQARQFCVHGWVRVNGKRMRHPGYLLNPGDMFSVEPDRVMFATGAKKGSKNGAEGLSRGTKSGEEGEEAAREEEAEDQEGGEEVAETEETDVQAEQDSATDPKDTLKALLSEAKEMLKDPSLKASMSGKQKQSMRQFSRQLRSTMSRIRGDTVKTAEGERKAEDTVEELRLAMEKLTTGTNASTSGQEAAETKDTAAAEEDEDSISPERDAQILRSALDLASEDPDEAEDDVTQNVVDATKPYAMPWKPRDYMSAFAFIPRYLEVNQKICSAVYLRHPVARPGLAEVPAPFSEELYELTHNWYLRRR